MAEKELKFEDAMERLDGIVESLESDNTSLEDSIRLYDEGIKLVKVCEKKLASAEAKLEKILPQSSDDKPEVGHLKSSDS